VEGVIGFTALHQTVMLNPDERVMLSLGEGTVTKDRINVEKTLAWKKGKYYYSNEKLPAIIRQLQRWYDVEFVFNERELSDYYFTGVINHEKSIRYNMELIELTNKVKVEFNDDQIIIKAK
jgi:ferric-dicitrate binding protein FerR (iron transport regulator)